VQRVLWQFIVKYFWTSSKVHFNNGLNLIISKVHRIQKLNHFLFSDCSALKPVIQMSLFKAFSQRHYFRMNNILSILYWFIKHGPLLFNNSTAVRSGNTFNIDLYPFFNVLLKKHHTSLWNNLPYPT
jgi:hypothetical protein